MRPTHCLQSLRVGQSQVEQGDVEGTLPKLLFGFTHALGLPHFGFVRSCLIEHLPKQTSVSGVVLDQEKQPKRLPNHAFCLGCGNLTLVSQKSLMLFTKASNASSCTGLLR